MSKPQALCIHVKTLSQLLEDSGLTIPTNVVISLTAGEATAFLANLNKLVDELWYIPRSHCETDNTFRQLLPYVVVTNHKNNLVGYNRPTKKGGEGRLAGKFSIGIGGHVEPIDHNPTPVSLLHWAAIRELQEELDAEGVSDENPWEVVGLRLIGLIISDDSPVDSVHLGLVYKTQWFSLLDRPYALESNEPDQICNLRTLTLEQAGIEPNPESWTAKILASGMLEG